MKIKMQLSQKSIKEAIQQIEKYKADLDRKCERLIEKLAKEGISVIRQVMVEIPDDEKGSYYTEAIYDNQQHIKGVAIRLTGDKVLFIEFSAGITYGQKDYPLPSGNQYGMGTYPGKGHWDNPSGWWYTDESGEVHHSYGNRAYMPMYKADMAMIMQIRYIAKEVFET